MERAKRRKSPRWFRIALGLMILVLGLLASAVALRFWITSDAGRAFVLSQIDGRKVGPLGTLRLSGLKGDPLQSATLADIALVDDDGVWLRARDARIEWTPTSLFASQLEIQKINIRTIDVLRRPRLALQEDSSPGPDIGLRLDSVSVDDLHLDPAVLGIDARYSLDGAAARPRDGSGLVRLTLSPVSGPADAADISADWTASGKIKGSAALSGPPGGLIGTLLQAPPEQNVAFRGDVSGTLQAFTSQAALTFDGESVAAFRLTRDGDTATLTGQLDAERWPLLATLAQRAGGPIDIQGGAALADPANAPVTLVLSAPAGTIEGATDYDFTAPQVPSLIETRAQGLDFATLLPPLAGKVDATGTLGIGLNGIDWKGDVEAAQLAWPSGRAASVSAPVSVHLAANRLSWEAMGAHVEGGRIDALPDLAPARYAASARGEVNLRTGLVEIYAARVEGQPGAAAARGSYDSFTGAMDFQGSVRLARLGDVAPLTGAATGRWSVRAKSSGSPIRVSADMEGRNVGSHIASLAELAGSTPRVTLSGVVSKGRFAIESGAVEGAAIRANMTGAIADSGAINARANGRISRSVDLGGVTVDSAAFNADISGDIERPQVRVRLSDGSLLTAGVRISELAGTAEARLGEAVTGRFSLTGASAQGPFRAAGRIEAGEGDWRIVGLAASLGDLTFDSPSLVYSEGALAMTFTAKGPLAGLAGLDRGALNASGTLEIGDELVADINGRVTDIRSSALRLDLVSFAATASGGVASLEAQARGSLGAPLDITLKATGRQQGETWTGDATIQGTVDRLPVRTSRPAIWRQGPEGWSLDAAFAALRGDIDLDLASNLGAASGRIELRGVNLRGLSRLARVTPIDGTVTGAASFTNGAGPASGELRLAIADANPVGVTADPVSLNLQANLRDGVLASVLTGEGQGFKLDAASSLPVREGAGFDIALDAGRPMQSTLDLHGRAEQLWALFGPEGQSLRGELTASLRVAGTPGQPLIEGGIDVADGAFEHGETGLALRDITARGIFDQNAARIANLSARDGKGGTLTGQGELTWNGRVHGGITFKASELRALGRDDRFAIVSGDGAINVGETNIEVTGDFAVSQARISIEQPASESIPTIPGLRRTNFPNREEEEEAIGPVPPWQRPIQLDLTVTAPRRVAVFGRGLDTEWAADIRVTGPISDPSISGTAALVRGDLDLAGRRFQFDTGAITLDGPIRTARINIAADRTTADITASVRVTGTPVEPKFTLESTPALPQDEVLARVLFGRSVTELSGFEAAQLAAGLAQLAGGQAGFDPVGLVRQATGLDRVSFGAEGGIATVSAGKYLAEDVYLQVGAGGTGGVGAEVEWEPTDGLSIISAADGNGDTKIAVRWKKDY